LMLLSWSLLRQNTLLHKMTRWWPIPKNIANHLTSIIISAYSVPFLMENT
jgi:hypothetical protein